MQCQNELSRDRGCQLFFIIPLATRILKLAWTFWKHALRFATLFVSWSLLELSEKLITYHRITCFSNNGRTSTGVSPVRAFALYCMSENDISSLLSALRQLSARHYEYFNSVYIREKAMLLNSRSASSTAIHGLSYIDETGFRSARLSILLARHASAVRNSMSKCTRRGERPGSLRTAIVNLHTSLHKFPPCALAYCNRYTEALRLLLLNCRECVALVDYIDLDSAWAELWIA